MLDRIQDTSHEWDIIIIGGGATGLGAAIDATARGYSTLLLERYDFSKGTSSRSTKLVHGGVRYLQQGNVSLVIEALRERGRMLRNAPHLVTNLPFVVPNYDWWEGPFYGIGLKIYDMLAGKEGFGASKHLSRKETLERIPTLEPEGLRGGTIYYDGQFDDARLAVNMAQTAAEQGGVLLNYAEVTGLKKTNDFVSGVRFTDTESGREYELSSKVVINATGVFTDSIRKMDEAACQQMVQPSQGVHVVLDRSFLPGNTAIMVPQTDDGRVLFAIPWHDRTVVGTTDTAVDNPSFEPLPLNEELDFILTHARRYLTNDPEPADVLSCFAGLRPLVRNPDAENTAEISRDHTILISRSGLLTVTGGKWTTYRKMGEDTIDQAITLGQLEERPCVTYDLQLHGWHEYAETFGQFEHYGADAPQLQSLINGDPDMAVPLHPDLPYVKGEVIWALRHEMARTVEDILSRRTRALLLDARASIASAPVVADLMATELGQNDEWKTQQVVAFNELAAGYLMST